MFWSHFSLFSSYFIFFRYFSDIMNNFESSSASSSSGDDELSLGFFSQSQEEGRVMNLSATDPRFNSKEEMAKYLKEIDQKDTVILDEQGKCQIKLGMLSKCFVGWGPELGTFLK